MHRYFRIVSRPRAPMASLCLAFFVLASCDETGGFSAASIFSPASDTPDRSGAAVNESGATEQDVEAPDVFATTEAGLWDGRPSLGGIWVAHPDAEAPERVIIRNQANGEEVVGALFRRERAQAGPRLQVSSEAAEALGMLAGAPVSMEVVALRKELIATPAEEPTDPAKETVVATAPAAVTETQLAPAEVTAAATADAQKSEAAAQNAPVSTLPETSLDRPYLQAAVFTGEENAKRAVAALENDGLPAAARSTQSSGKEIWRVVVGPMLTVEDRNDALQKVKAAGFTDAYPVTR